MALDFIACARARGTLYILTEHETGNVTLVREQGKRSATYGSYS